METAVLVLAILAAVLIMACGVWVLVVLMATVARARPHESSSPTDQVTQDGPC